MNDCIFCKIIRKEIPSNIVYEDDQVIAFLDISPVASGHTLVVPKEHSQDLFDTSPEVLQAWMDRVQKIAAAVRSAVGAEGIVLIQNSGAAAGQTVWHLHMHIIPRNSGDGLRHWAQSSYPSPDIADGVARSVRDALGS